MSALLAGWFKMDVGEGAFYAVFGLAFVILGIALLVLFFMALGAVMNKINGRKGKRKKESGEEKPPAPVPALQSDETDPAVVAAIMAAVAAYYTEQPQKCEFVVRRIKKI